MFKKLFESLGENRKMVLATSYKDRVTARMMSVIITDEKFYLQTDKNFLKYQQLQANPKVALCCDNIQIEGIANDIGKPKDNKMFLEKFEKYFKASYNSYSFLEDERLIEIVPTFITVWNYKDGQAIRENYCFIKRVYSEESYIGK